MRLKKFSQKNDSVIFVISVIPVILHVSPAGLTFDVQEGLAGQ